MRSSTEHGSRPLAVHWLILAAYPAMFLYSRNASDFSPEVMLVPALITLLCAMEVWGLLSLILRNTLKASLITSLALVLVFFYGHAVALIGNPHFYVQGIHIGHHKILLPLMSLLLVAGAVWIIATRRKLFTTTKVLNVAAGVLGLIATGTTVAAKLSDGKGLVVATYQVPDAPPTARVDPAPDIYYIILDAYGRADTLKTLYRFDNEPFIDALRAKGFYVADRARANYPQTALSLACSMNMEYLDLLTAAVGKEKRDHLPLRHAIADSSLLRFLKARRYKTVAYDSGAEVTPRRGMDVWLSQGPDLGEFGQALLETTPVPVFMRDFKRYDLHRRTVLHTLETLPDLAAMRGPKFVLAHVLCPHPPFVFDETGKAVTPSRPFSADDGSAFMALRGASRVEYIEGYRKQVAFINARILAAIDDLIRKSERPPIIVIQGDHGPGSMLNWESLDETNLSERMGILNAYHLPPIAGAGAPDLREDLSPVNSFRCVLRYYFGAELDPLPDRSFYSTAGRPYDFTEVTDRLNRQERTERDQRERD
ncbi:MAG: sulfatase-like hydrolase/transferase [Planctomycetaceae bacterium]|nr:sulfatase-like hydrolase/transferase [Planctomycetaceae bacterium]